MRARRDFSHIQRPVGVHGIRFRSKAECNYAAYLEWLLKIRKIKFWDYEPRTFWFTADEVKNGGVKRGVVSYKPDFYVLVNGQSEWHEVKGWMDARSRVALKRMAKYYPAVKVEVIDSRQMAALKKQVGGIVPGWLP